jgi:hypothetical protein
MSSRTVDEFGKSKRCTRKNSVEEEEEEVEKKRDDGRDYGGKTAQMKGRSLR